MDLTAISSDKDRDVFFSIPLFLYLCNTIMDIQIPQFDLVKRDDDYVIYQDDVPLQTDGGHEVSGSNGRLLKHIMTDMMVSDSARRAISFRLFQWQRDGLEQGDDPVDLAFPLLLASDPFVQVKTGSGKKKPTDKNAFTEEQATISFWTFSGLLSIVNTLYEENLKNADLIASHEDPFIAIIINAYSKTTLQERSAVNLLVKEHEPGIVLPMLLVKNLISPGEYAKGMISLTSGHPEEQSYDSVIHDASSVRDYLLASQPTANEADKIEELIHEGEGTTLEFKSTLRWDLRQGKTSQQIERACLKTIAAFLNSDGGTLMVGVRDNGSIEGIESDNLKTDDRWLLHLWTLIRTSFGKDVSPNIHTQLEKIDGKTICLVQCSRSSRPVFLRQRGFDEEFYIRIGPGSAAMVVSEALKYIADHFPAG